MDESLVRDAVDAFKEAVVAGDLELAGTYFADRLRARDFTLSAEVDSSDVVAVEPRGSEMVVRVRFQGKPATVVAEWTGSHGTRETVPLKGEATVLDSYWTEQAGSPRVVGFGTSVPGGRWSPDE
jgi:hypothetical protein